MEMGKKFKIMGMVPATMAPLLNDFPVSGFGLYNSTKKKMIPLNYNKLKN